MEWFTENSFIPLVTGIALVFVSIAMAVGTGERVMYRAAAVIFFLTLAIVVTEQLIVTEKEEVTEEVYQLAFHVRQNRMNEVLRKIHPDATDLISEVNSQMPRLEFDTCRILKITGFRARTENDDEAVVEFTSALRASIDGSGKMPGLRRVKLGLRKDEHGEWLVTRLQHENPNRGINP